MHVCRGRSCFVVWSVPSHVQCAVACLDLVCVVWSQCVCICVCTCAHITISVNEHVHLPTRIKSVYLYYRIRADYYFFQIAA